MHLFRISAAASTACICLVSFMSGAASAQVNDSLANAHDAFVFPYADGTLSNVGAGSETGELLPSCGSGDTSSIWWSITPGFPTTRISVSTAGSDFDTIVSVYTGTGHPLNEIACNDDDPGVALTSKTSFVATSGVTYYIRVSGFGGAEGNVFLFLNYPADDLNDATSIPGLAFVDTVLNTNATVESGEMIATCGNNNTNSVWWRYVPADTHLVHIDTEGSNFDTILSVHTGFGHPLTEIGCDDDGGSGTLSALSFQANLGTTYYIRVVGFSTASGQVALRVTGTGDLLSKAVVIPSLPFTDKLSNVGASVEPGEQSALCAPDNGNSLWWRYTATSNNKLVADTDTSNFNTILSVYSTSGSSLNHVDCDDDLGTPIGTSRLVFQALTDSTYFFRVAGFDGDAGEVNFKLHMLGDNIDDVRPVASLPFTESLVYKGADTESFEPITGCGTFSGTTIWWTYTAAYDGALTANTIGSGYDTFLCAFSGTPVPDSLVNLAADDDSGGGATSSLTIPVSLGTTYYFSNELLGAPIGNSIVLNLIPISNDFLVGAKPISSLPYADTAWTLGATLEPNEASASCSSDGGKSFWWKYTAPSVGRLTFDTSDSGFDTILSVFKGNAHPLNEIACNDDGGPSNTSRLTIYPQVDSTYYVRVSSYSVVPGGHVELKAYPSIMFSGNVLLEGPYAGAGSMNTPGAFDGVRPFFQPYSDPSFNGSLLDFDSNYSSTSAQDGNVVDWILGSLRTGLSDSTEVPGTEQPLLLLDNGSIFGVDDSVRFAAPPGSYYLVLRHRNHLAVMSKDPVDFTTGSGFWNFSSIGKAHSSGGTPMKDLTGGFYGMFAGDANFDGQITASDFNIWLTKTKAVTTGYFDADHNLDSQATVSDFNTWLTNTKAVATSQVPN